MKNLTRILITALMFPLALSAQFHNKGAKIIVQNGAYIHSTMDIQNNDGGFLTNEGSVKTTQHLKNTNTAHLAGTGSFFIGKNWENYASLVPGNSMVTFDEATQSQIISGGGVFYNVTLNKAPGRYCYLGQPMVINNVLHFHSVNSFALGTHHLTVNTITGAPDGGIIITDNTGLVRKELTGTTFTFPIGYGTGYNGGDDNNTLRYGPVTVTSPTALNNQLFEAGFYFIDPASATFPLGAPFSATALQNLCSVSDKEYWDVNSTASVQLTFSWSAASNVGNLVSDLADLRVAGWDGTKWVNLGQHSVTGNLVAGTITAPQLIPNHYTVFTLAAKGIPPTLVCPANQTVAASATCEGSVGAWSPASATDNCNPPSSLNTIQSPAAATALSGHNDSETVTLTATDNYGNVGSCSFSVTLKDVTTPSITCPTNKTVNADASCSGTVGAWSLVSKTDNCAATANITETQSPASGTLLNGHNDVETVTLTANDGNGNSANCTFTVTLKDVSAPAIACPVNQNINANASCSGTIGTWSAASLSDNCNANPTVTQSPAASAVMSGHNATQTVTLTANDGNGNSATCSFTLTLKDVGPPTVVCRNYTANLNAAGVATVAPANVYQNGADNCGVVNLISVSPSSFICSNIGSNLVTLTVNDGNGNGASCNAFVTVADAIAPTMLCRPVTLNLNGAGQATLTVAQVNNGSFDNCTISTMSLGQTNFNCTHVGQNNVILTGRDQSNNTGQCTALVTVVDPILPLAKCKNITANLGPNGSVTVAASAVNNGSSDNCSFSLTLFPNTFSCANIGANFVVLRATDGSGNSATCQARVTVKDITAPIAKCKNPTIFLNSSGQATLSAAQVNNNSSDNCNIVSMTLNHAQFNCTNINGTNPVTLTLKDAANNTSSCNALVTVKDNLAPTAICENTNVMLGSNGTVTVYGADLAAESYDNCSVWSYSPIAKVYNAAGVYNLNITVKDWSGNTATCVSEVTVTAPLGGDDGDRSNEPPLPAQLTLYPNPAVGDVVLAFQMPVAQDYSIRIFSVAGQLVLSDHGVGEQGENYHSIHLDGLAPGVYWVEFWSKNLMKRNKLLLLG